MRLLNVKFIFLGKLLLATVAIVALVSLPLRALLPGISLGHLVFYSVAGLAGMLVLLVVGAVCSLQFSQLVLRMGGTDTQWFWFSAEPPGLVALRAGKRVGKDMP